MNIFSLHFFILKDKILYKFNYTYKTLWQCLGLRLDSATARFLPDKFRKHGVWFYTLWFNSRAFLTDFVGSSHSACDSTLLNFQLLPKSSFSAQNTYYAPSILSQIFCQRCCLCLLYYNRISLKNAHFPTLTYPKFTHKKNPIFLSKLPQVFCLKCDFCPPSRLSQIFPPKRLQPVS